MSWIDQFRPGSFRGVGFEIVSHDAEGGRRLALHEFPERDAAFAEDLGRRPRRFRVEAQVRGPDYHEKRDRLQRVLEEPGPGTLVHPFLGTAEVVVESFTLREEVRRLALASFSIQFVEPAPEPRPDRLAAPGAAPSLAADEAQAEFQRLFEAYFSVEDAPAFVSEDAGSMLDGAARGIRNALDRLSAVNPFELTQAVRRLSAEAADFVRQPANLARTVIATVRSLPLVAAGLAPTDLNRLLPSPLGQPNRRPPRPGAAQSALLAASRARPEALAAVQPQLRALGTFGRDLAPVMGATPSRVQQRQNRRELALLVRRAAVTAAAEAAIAQSFASAEDALSLRDALARRLDAEAAAAAATEADAVQAALSRLRAALVRDLSRRGASLARIVRLRVGGTRPAVAIAQSFYGDDWRDVLARSDEIVQRNRIRHPGFVPSNTSLELLTRVA